MLETITQTTLTVSHNQPGNKFRLKVDDGCAARDHIKIPGNAMFLNKVFNSGKNWE